MNFIKIIKMDTDRYIYLDLITGKNQIISSDDLNQIKEKVYDQSQTQKMLENFKNMYLSLSKIYVFVLNYKCNYDCNFCFEDLSVRCKNIKLTKEQISNIFTIIKSIDNTKNTTIHLYGGEPLLVENIDLVEFILQKGRLRGDTFFIPSNGYYLDQYIDLLKQSKDLIVQITLDGTEDIYNKRRHVKLESNPFKKVVRNIDLAIANGIQLKIRINVDEFNVNNLSNLIKTIEQKGWFKANISAYLTPMRKEKGRCYRWFNETLVQKIESLGLLQNPKIVMSDEMSRKIFNSRGMKIQFYPCFACYRQFFFDGAGDIYPCAESIGDKNFTIGKYGKKISFNDTYFFLKERNVLEIGGKCSKCTNLLFCGSGCPYSSFLETQNFEEGHCESFEDIEYYLKELGKRY